MSKSGFETALRLAGSRGLLESGTPDLQKRREAFAAELAEGVRRLDAIEAFAAAQHTGIAV